MQRRIHNTGFTLIETLTYGVGIIIVLGGIVVFLVSLYNWYRSATIPTRADEVGMTLLARIMADVRGANATNDAYSIYNSQNGKLSLTALSSSGTATTTVYALEGGVMQHKVNTTATTTASPSDVQVSAFYIKKLTTPISTVVRVEVDVTYSLKGESHTSVYNGLAVLRQSYE